MKIILGVVLAFSAVAIGQTKPALGTGNRLIDQCAHADDPDAKPNATFYEVGYCAGLIRGVALTLHAFGALELPDGWTMGQLIRVVNKYLQDHPQQLAEKDTVLVGVALMEAFPPKAKPTKN